jgi:hypothetical protein
MELAVETSAERLPSLRDALWSLDGLARSMTPHFGALTLVSGKLVSCETFEYSGPGGTWLALCAPSKNCEVYFPELWRGDIWPTELQRTLLEVADRLIKVAPFSLAFIGESTGGQFCADDFQSGDRGASLLLARSSGVLLGPPLINRELEQYVTSVRPSGLGWFSPPTKENE